MKRPTLKDLAGTIYLLAQKPPKGQRPTKFLVDTRLWPAGGYSTDLAKARRWNDESGPRQYLNRHPKLKRTEHVRVRHYETNFVIASGDGSKV